MAKMSTLTYPYRQFIPFQDLSYDLENRRFPPQADQIKARETMLRRKGSEIMDLARHIVKYGKLNPTDTSMVVPDPADKTGKLFIVMEGNRHLTALKLLHNPNLADVPGFSASYQVEIRRLHNEFIKAPINEMEAVVYADRHDPEMDMWRRIKHSGIGIGGVAPIEWDGMAKERDRADRNEASDEYTFIQSILTHRDAPAELREAADEGRLPISTIGKALDSADIRKVLGIERKKDKLTRTITEDEYFRRGLALINDFLKPIKGKAKKTEGSISDVSRAKAYAADLEKALGTVKPEQQEEAKPVPTPTPTTQPAATPTEQPTSSARPHPFVVPADFKPSGMDPKASELLRELRERIYISKGPICVAVGIRALIEYTLYAFLKEFNLTLVPDGLKDVGTRVAGYMQNTNAPILTSNKGKKKSDQQKVPFDKNIVTALQNRYNLDDENSIQALHNFVHNPAIIPKEAQLRSL